MKFWQIKLKEEEKKKLRIYTKEFIKLPQFASINGTLRSVTS